VSKTVHIELAKAFNLQCEYGNHI